jgi:site-specific DNA-methyltransferase (adenine-specific)
VQPAANQVYQGDCVAWLERIEPGGVDLVFADPPFNIGYAYDVYQDRRSRDEYLAWTRRWMAGVWRVLRPQGTFWLAIGDEFAAELKLLAQQLLDKAPGLCPGVEGRKSPLAAGDGQAPKARRKGRRAKAAAAEPQGFACRSWVVWYYTFGVNCTRAFSRSHTHLFYFVKDPKRFTFNAEDPAIRVPSARQLVYADGRANPRGRLPDNTWILRPQDVPGGFGPRHDTWYFPRVAGTFKEREGFHGCQMPEQLLGRILQCCSNPGDLVLDPFAGSGTTLAVAKKLRRQWIGLELSPDYVERIGLRLASARPGDPLDGAADPLTSAPSTAAGKPRRTPQALRLRLRKRSGENQAAVQQSLPFLQAPRRRAARGPSSRTVKKQPPRGANP